ncbi:MAG: hybrid sensor histidine kinase/response regulator [Chloroflexi bacterium]|nr:hybrid sensor histidine kinase/response regulator [Chloroflexota bacterium]
MTEPNRYRILLIEDSEADAALVKQQLSRDGVRASYQRVDNPADLHMALEKEPWDIALCDYAMPGFSGLEAMRLIRGEKPETPCIIVSGQIGEEVAVEAMKAGASDYIMKDKLKRLAPAVRRELEEARMRLEKQRIQRTLKDKEEELLVVRELERAKDEFIGFVSHELRTPITVIIGALSTLLTAFKQLSEEDKLELASDALSGAEGLADIIENLLYLARSQMNKLQMRREEADPSEIISGVLQKIKGGAADYQFTVECPDSIRISVDTTMMMVILNNLISNAVKYSPASEVRISVQGKNGMALVSVSDRGRGISEEDQKKLFSAFERLAAASGPVGGLGLGLLVCRRLVEAQGGKIWVESRLGQGSTFYFTVPLV